MKIVLVRHGKYVTDDSITSYPLSAEGRADIMRLADHLSKINLKIPHVFHSTKMRALATAQILANVVNESRCEYLEGLEPNDHILPMLKKIWNFSEDVMIVGHLPFLSKLTSMLLVQDENANLIDFHPGTAVCLNYDNHYCNILWVLSPSLY